MGTAGRASEAIARTLALIPGETGSLPESFELRRDVISQLRDYFQIPPRVEKGRQVRGSA